MFDLLNITSRVQLLIPATYTGDQTATHADRQGFNALVHEVDLGNSGDTLSSSVKIDLILEHGDESDDSDMAAVTDASHVVGGTPDSNGIWETIDAPAEDSTIKRIGYVGPKRYSRVKLDFTGTHTNGIPLSVSALKGRAYVNP